MTPWKAPARPSHEITQPFNSGIVNIYSPANTAPPGYAPVIGPGPLKISLRYEDRAVGVTRLYQAKQNQIEIERVLRTPRAGKINNQDIAVTEDGTQYSIDSVQLVTGVYPPAQDITLIKREQVPATAAGEEATSEAESEMV